MCMEDYRLGRKTLSRELAFTTVATVAQQIVGGSPLRVAIILGAPIAGTLTYSTNPTPTTGRGINVGAGQPPVTLTIKEEGEIVTHQWWVVDDGTGRSATMVETNLAET